MSEELVYNIIELVMPFLGIGLSFLVLYIIFYAIKSEHKVKMALIEKGMDPSLASKRDRRKHSGNDSNLLKNGLFFIGLALGILLGYLLNQSADMNAWVSYPSMILIFGGLALIGYHALARGKRESVKTES